MPQSNPDTPTLSISSSKSHHPQCVAPANAAKPIHPLEQYQAMLRSMAATNLRASTVRFNSLPLSKSHCSPCVVVTKAGEPVRLGHDIRICPVRRKTVSVLIEPEELDNECGVGVYLEDWD